MSESSTGRSGSPRAANGGAPEVRGRSSRAAMAMRCVYLALIIVLSAVVLLFKFQNLELVTVSFFSARVTLPLSIMVMLVYVLGMVTGGSLLSLVRSWIRGAKRGRTAAP